MPKPQSKSIVIILMRNGGRMQFDSDYDFNQVKKIVEADEYGEWARFDVIEENPNIADMKMGVRRKDIVNYSVLMKADTQIDIIKPQLDISKLGLTK